MTALLVSSTKGRGSNSLIPGGRSCSSLMSRRCREKTDGASVTSPISGAEFSAADAGGEPGGFGASAHAELGEDAGHVMLGCLPGDEQPLGDLGVRQALADKPQHFLLALGEPADVLRAAPRRPHPKFPQQCRCRVGVAARAKILEDGKRGAGL